MASEAATRRELQKILGFEESFLNTNSISSNLHDKLDPDLVMIAEANESVDSPSTFPTSDSEAESLSRLKAALLPPTGPSLLLSDPSIPKSTSAYSSKRTTGQPSFTESVIRRGALESALRVQSERLYPPTGLQVGGNHYKRMPIQPVEFVHANNIPFIEGCVIKYVCRWRDKGGLDDLRKAKHFIDILIELEEKE